METTKFYDWAKTLSYDAEVTMVITARGRGKTYGIRAQAVRDWLKEKYRFVEVCRNRQEVPGVAAEYLAKVDALGEFPAWQFKNQGDRIYIARRVDEDSDERVEWHLIGYVVALSQAQQLKKRTFANVKRIIFDEALIDKRDRYHDYLPREYVSLANLVDTIARQQPGEETPCRLYLLGNACDLINPYFIRYGIYEQPKYGYRWYDGKHFLLHFEDPGEFGTAKLRDTMAGHMFAGTEDEGIATRNRFTSATRTFIGKKGRRAEFSYGVTYNEMTFGIWVDLRAGYYYVNREIPHLPNKVMYALSTADHKPNYLMANKGTRALRGIVSMYEIGAVKFDTAATREQFNNVLGLFGIR